MKTAALRALYNNLEKNEELALKVDAAIRRHLQDDWRNNKGKTKLVRNGIRAVFEEVHAEAQAAGLTGVQDSGADYSVEAEATRVLELAKHQNDY